MSQDLSKFNNSRAEKDLAAIINNDESLLDKIPKSRMEELLIMLYNKCEEQDNKITELNGKLIVENIIIDTVTLKPSAFSYVDLDVAKDGYGVISAFMDVPANSADVQYSIVRHPTILTTLRIQAKNNTSMQTTFGGTVCVTYMKTN